MDCPDIKSPVVILRMTSRVDGQGQKPGRREYLSE